MNVLVMCLGDPTKNPRPNRIIKYLDAQGYVVDTMNYPFEIRSLNVRAQITLKSPITDFISRVSGVLIYLVSSILARFKLIEFTERVNAV